MGTPFDPEGGGVAAWSVVVTPPPNMVSLCGFPTTNSQCRSQIGPATSIYIANCHVPGQSGKIGNIRGKIYIYK